MAGKSLFCSLARDVVYSILLKTHDSAAGTPARVVTATQVQEVF